VFADNFIDDKPTTPAYAPNLLFVAQDAHTAGLLNGFPLRACQFHLRRTKRFTGKNRLLRLICGQILNRKRGRRHQSRDWQRDKGKFRLHRLS
jgi:hypothetical protein